MKKKSVYSYWFLVPMLVIYVVLFIIPIAISFFFSLTNWTFDGWSFCGIENFKTFFTEPSLYSSIGNTFLCVFNKWLKSGSVVSDCAFSYIRN